MFLYSEPQYLLIEQPYVNASQQEEINAYLIPTNEENLFYLVDSNFFHAQPTMTTTIKIEISIQNPNVYEESFQIFNDNENECSIKQEEEDEMNDMGDTELDSSIYNCCMDSFSSCYPCDSNFIEDDFLVSLDNPKIPNHLKRRHQLEPLIKQIDDTNNFSFTEAKCLNNFLHTIPEGLEYFEIDDDDDSYDDFSDWDSSFSDIFPDYLP